MLLISTLLVLGLISYVLFIKRKHPPFHVKVEPMEIKVKGINIIPLLVFFFKLLPESMRRAFAIKEVILL